jgi:hypothetical protein
MRSAGKMAVIATVEAVRRLAVIALVGVLGCDRDQGAPPGASAAPQMPVASVARALGIDAGELEPTADPPAPAGDLKADLDAFTTIDACVQQRAAVDPVLGDALESIGYDTFLRDACRVLDAAKAHEAKRCDGIDASGLRARCQATVAEVAGNAEACPWEIPSKPARGREPACVAIAERDARLCVAVIDRADRATCDAIASGKGDACAKLPRRVDQARCARDADRWRTSVPAPSGDTPGALATPAGKLHVEGGDGGAPVDADIAQDVTRGVVVVEQLDGVHFVVGPLDDAGPGFIAPSPHVAASVAVDLFVPSGLVAGKDRPVRIDRAQLLVPGQSPLATPAARSTLVAKVDKMDRKRGAEVHVVIDGALGDARVHAEATTFVRDVVKASAIYDVGAPRLGGDGGAR